MLVSETVPWTFVLTLISSNMFHLISYCIVNKAFDEIPDKESRPGSNNKFSQLLFHCFTEQQCSFIAPVP